MSQHECNKMMRVLGGGSAQLKFTVRVHHKDGNVTEFQSNERPKLDYNNEARCLFLSGGDYGSAPIMAWPEGAVMLCEENPKV